MANTKHAKCRSLGIITSVFYPKHENILRSVNRLSESVERWGYNLKIIKGNRCGTFKEVKASWIIPYIKKMNKEWIMWIDASDTFFARDPSIAIDILEKCGKSILISSERNCWPEKSIESFFPKVSTDDFIGSRYLNSGVFIGRKKEIIKHLEMVDSIKFNCNEEKREFLTNDQWIWQKIFIDQKKLGASISIDTKCSMSISTFKVDINELQCYERKEEKCLQIKSNGVKPVVIHFNGDDKYNSEKINSIMSMCSLSQAGGARKINKKRKNTPPEHYHRDGCFGKADRFNWEKFYRWMVESFDSGSHFVEIGSWTGRSSAFMAVEIWRSGKAMSLDCVDTWKGSKEHHSSEEVLSGDMYGMFTNNMKRVKGRYKAVRMGSIDAAKLYDDGSLDFVFIDGDHAYDSVMGDIRAWLPKVRKGGVIGGHDYRVWSGVTRGVHDSFGHDFHQYMGDVWFKVI